MPKDLSDYAYELDRTTSSGDGNPAWPVVSVKSPAEIARSIRERGANEHGYAPSKRGF